MGPRRAPHDPRVFELFQTLGEQRGGHERYPAVEVAESAAAAEQFPEHERGPPPDAVRRVWNGTIHRRPALVARCSGVADVRAAVRFARERQLVVAMRGGGHNVARTATCDGGVVIDLSPMKGLQVDPVTRTERAAGPAVGRGQP